MQDYGEHIKKRTRILVNMGYPISAWEVGTCFRLGLNSDLAPYTFQLLLAARMQGKELDVDQLIHTMVDNEKRTTYMEGSQAKAMAVSRKYLADTLDPPPQNDRNRSRTPTPTGTKKRGKGPCQHCRSIYHIDNFCYYLHPEQRPSDWQPAEGREHFMVSGNSGSGNNGNAGARIMRAFTAKTTVSLTVGGKRDKIWWIDSAADVHMTYDKTLFTSYKAMTNKTVQTAEGNEMVVAGKGQIKLDVATSWNESFSPTSIIYQAFSII